MQSIAAKLRQSNAIATIVPLYWPNKTWYHDLQRLATATLHFPLSRDLFFPGKLGKHAGVGPPALSIVAFRVTPPHGSTPDAVP
jgi:hypothetical protein